ncbi:MAG: hypothetical protein PVI06_07310 [Desulfobacterales bacterium]|jgi:Fe-S-cluster containining protein
MRFVHQLKYHFTLWQGFEIKNFSRYPFWNAMPLLAMRQISDNRLDPYLERLTKIYSAMDRAYRSAANRYGFECRGCEDNCCRTRFYHYTYIEYLYILKGYDFIGADMRAKVGKRALKVVAEFKAADNKQIALRQMCPLNFGGRCILYHHRPMICRLHGIPHEFQTPHHRVIYAPGCDAFNRDHGNKDYYKFDRTPFYVGMAQLEKELKQALDINDKPRVTVAEMVVSYLQL